MILNSPYNLRSYPEAKNANWRRWKMSSAVNHVQGRPLDQTFPTIVSEQRSDESLAI